MPKVIFSTFIILHGLVHLLYFGQSWRFFELQTGMVWPDGSWAFSRLLGDDPTRTLASVACVLAALGFVAGSAGILIGQAWWRPMIVVAAAFSSVIYVLFWNGKMQHLDNQGAIGVLINVALLVALLVLQWPQFES